MQQDVQFPTFGELAPLLKKKDAERARSSFRQFLRSHGLVSLATDDLINGVPVILVTLREETSLTEFLAAKAQFDESVKYLLSRYRTGQGASATGAITANWRERGLESNMDSLSKLKRSQPAALLLAILLTGSDSVPASRFLELCTDVGMEGRLPNLVANSRSISCDLQKALRCAGMPMACVKFDKISACFVVTNFERGRMSSNVLDSRTLSEKASKHLTSDNLAPAMEAAQHALKAWHENFQAQVIRTECWLKLGIGDEDGAQASGALAFLIGVESRLETARTAMESRRTAAGSEAARQQYGAFRDQLTERVAKVRRWKAFLAEYCSNKKLMSHDELMFHEILAARERMIAVDNKEMQWFENTAFQELCSSNSLLSEVMRQVLQSLVEGDSPLSPEQGRDLVAEGAYQALVRKRWDKSLGPEKFASSLRLSIRERVKAIVSDPGESESKQKRILKARLRTALRREGEGILRPERRSELCRKLKCTPEQLDESLVSLDDIWVKIAMSKIEPGVSSSSPKDQPLPFHDVFRKRKKASDDSEISEEFFE